jgi:hypothetical protein
VQLRIENDGFTLSKFAVGVVMNGLNIRLFRLGKCSRRNCAGPADETLYNPNCRSPLDDYNNDRHDVTDAAFQMFIDAGAIAIALLEQSVRPPKAAR